MSLQGIILIDILGLAMIVLIFNFVRSKKLYIGYAVIWLAATLFLVLIVSVPYLLELLPKIVGAIFPASALSLIAFAFIFLVLILFSVKMSLISERQVKIAQALAISKLAESENQEPDQDSEENK